MRSVTSLISERSFLVHGLDRIREMCQKQRTRGKAADEQNPWKGNENRREDRLSIDGGVLADDFSILFSFVFFCSSKELFYVSFLPLVLFYSLSAFNLLTEKRRKKSDSSSLNSNAYFIRISTGKYLIEVRRKELTRSMSVKVRLMIE